MAALAWPKYEGSAKGVVAFIAGAKGKSPQIVRRLMQQLPPPLVPHKILFLDQLPLNSNGKVDYQALQARLEN